MTRTIAEAIADLEARLRRERPDVLQGMRPGLGAGHVKSLLADLGGSIDPGLASVYAWRNGGDDDLMEGARLLSLEEAIRARDFELQLAAQVESPPELRASEIFDSRWFPILQDAGGLVYVVEDFGRGRVLLVDREHVGNPEDLGASLLEFLDGIAREGMDFKPAPLSADVSTLVGRLEAGDAEERWSAVRELTRKRPLEAFDPLVAMLDSDDAPARRDAALLLGALGDPRAAPILAEHLARWAEPDATSARAALDQLERQGDDQGS